jgi:hypothetical protein
MGVHCDGIVRNKGAFLVIGGIAGSSFSLPPIGIIASTRKVTAGYWAIVLLCNCRSNCDVQFEFPRRPAQGRLPSPSHIPAERWLKVA